MRSYLTVLLLILATMGLSACNTTQGLGKDVEAIEEAAEDAEDEIEEM